MSQARRGEYNQRVPAVLPATALIQRDGQGVEPSCVLACQDIWFSKEGRGQVGVGGDVFWETSSAVNTNGFCYIHAVVSLDRAGDW